MFVSNLIVTLQRVVQFVADFYLAVIMLRFLLQVVRADFYNPVCQAIVSITAPLLNPLRRVIPGWRNLDIASLVLALIICILATALIPLLVGFSLPMKRVVAYAAVHLLDITLKIYFYAILASVVASWVAPFSGHPALLLLYQLLQPLYRLAHRILPPMGGMDFSPMLIGGAIWLAQELLLVPLMGIVGSL